MNTDRCRQSIVRLLSKARYKHYLCDLVCEKSLITDKANPIKMQIRNLDNAQYSKHIDMKSSESGYFINKK